MTWFNRIVLGLGGALLVVAALVPWARYGINSTLSVSLLEFHDGVANVAYIVAALSLGLVYRSRSDTGRRIGWWASLSVLAALVGVSIIDIARGDLLFNSSGWVVRNDVSVGPGPSVLMAAALLLVAAVLSHHRESS